MNSVVRTNERGTAVGRDALQAFLELEAAAGKLTDIDAAGAQAIITTGAPAALLAALDVPATSRDVKVALGSLMAAFPSASSKPDLDAFAAVLIDNLPDGLSNLVLRLAVKQLIRRQRFLPAVSEILDAIVHAERRIRDIPERLAKVAAYVSLEDTVWLDKDLDYALWRKIGELRGRGAPTDMRGGWYFLRSEVEQARAALRVSEELG